MCLDHVCDLVHAAGASCDVPDDSCILLLLPCSCKSGPAQGKGQHSTGRHDM
jgi:hypothetical protein